MKYYFAILAALVWSLLAHGQGTLTIDFDGPPLQPTNSQYGLTSYSESGMSFLPGPSDFDGQFERNGGGANGIDPYDGSAYLQAGLGESLLFRFSNGSLFGLTSIDLAAYSIHVPDFTVEFIGYHSDGSTIDTSFSATGANFKTYYFGSDWSYGLTRVEIPNAPWSLDNLAVTVPEPSSGQLFAIGALTFSTWRTRREKLK